MARPLRDPSPAACAYVHYRAGKVEPDIQRGLERKFVFLEMFERICKVLVILVLVLMIEWLPVVLLVL